MRINLIVEELSDLEFLARIMPTLGRMNVHLTLGVGAERYYAIIRTRSIRVDRGEAVILLLNARTMDEQVMLKDRGEIMALLTAAGPPLPVELIFAVPELEVVLFHDPAVLERLLGVTVTEEDRIEARFIPKAVLTRLLERSGRFGDTSELIDAMDEEAARRLSTHPLIRQIEARIADVKKNAIPEEFHYLLTG